MDNALALPQDEAAEFVETLKEVERKELGNSTVFYGRDESGFSYFVIFPPIGEAISIRSVPDLHSVT